MTPPLIAEIAAVRDMMLNRINASPIHARDDHNTEFCPFCRMLRLLDALTASEAVRGAGEQKRDGLKDAATRALLLFHIYASGGGLSEDDACQVCNELEGALLDEDELPAPPAATPAAPQTENSDGKQERRGVAELDPSDGRERSGDVAGHAALLVREAGEPNGRDAERGGVHHARGPAGERPAADVRGGDERGDGQAPRQGMAGDAAGTVGATPAAEETQKLHTLDGVEITVGMKVFWNSGNPRTAEGVVVMDVDEFGATFDDDGEELWVPLEWAYSSPDALAKAAAPPPAAGAAEPETVPVTVSINERSRSRLVPVADAKHVCGSHGFAEAGGTCPRCEVERQLRDELMAPAPPSPGGTQWIERLKRWAADAKMEFTEREFQNVARMMSACFGNDEMLAPMSIQDAEREFSGICDDLRMSDGEIDAIVARVTAPSDAGRELAAALRGLPRWGWDVDAGEAWKERLPDGEYVLWSDVEALAARVERKAGQ